VISRYCTAAVTVDGPVGVKVQLLAFFPLLEQGPDQMTSRPPVALNVTAPVNCAPALVPTGTLRPAGLETMLTPLRPVAVTVTIWPCPEHREQW
jgi:hypothetical protein